MSKKSVGSVLEHTAKSEAKMSSAPRSGGEILLFRSEDGSTRVECRFVDEQIWLTQKLIGELFHVTVPTVNEHLKGIYDEGELDPDRTIRKFRIVRAEGARQVAREVEHYNLQAILAVGFRVRSPRGTQFRQWATSCLDEFTRKGFLLDDERLKNPPGPGVLDHFDEVLERIRDIRASEKRVYLRVREILALAADYEPKTEQTQVFFQTVQNKLHFAATGKTASELIAERADHAKPNMGLTVWKGTVVRRGDVMIAKNYLFEPEIVELNRIVTMFLDYAEDQARRRKQVFMLDWKKKLDEFLRFNERNVLGYAGSVSREAAEKRAQREYDHFEQQRRRELEVQGENEAIRQLEALAGQRKDRKKS